MKLLMLAPEFIPVRGGVGTYIVELIRNMPKDVEIHVLTPEPTINNNIEKTKNYFSKETEQSIFERIKLHYLGTVKDDFFYNFKFQINCYKSVPKMIKQHEFDIVHSESALPDLYVNPKRVNIPIVTTIHSTITDEIDSAKSSNSKFFDLANSEKFMIILSPVLKSLENMYYSGDRKYITVSEWMKNHVTNTFKKIQPDQIKVIHNGVDTDRFHPMEKIHLNKYFPELSDIESPKALFLSRWAARKGIAYMLKALPKILKKTDIHFIFAGPSQNIKFQKAQKNCTFLGYIPHNKIPCLYASSDIFLLPSLYENFPICLLEAMSAELGVIGTNVGGIPEMVTHKENGLIIRPKNTNDIVDSVVKLIEDDKLKKELGRNARQTVRQQFDWGKIAMKTKEYYQKLIDAC